MTKIANNSTELKSHTPLAKINKVFNYNFVELMAKPESYNPAGSAEARTVLNKIEDAGKKCLIHKNDIVVESTSDNTRVRQTFAAVVKGYRLTHTIPGSISFECRHRSILKAISYRVTGTCLTFIVAYLLTGKFIIAASIGGIEALSKILVYYLHERLWNKIKYGTKPARPEYEI